MPDYVEIVRALQPPPDADVARDLFLRDADEATVAAATEAFGSLLTEDFVCIFHRASDQERPGPEGLRAAWLDWLEPWETYRAVVEEVVQVDESRVMVVARDFARRAGMSDEIEMHGIALYTFRDGLISRMEFFTQRAEAYAAAGIEPPT